MVRSGALIIGVAIFSCAMSGCIASDPSVDADEESLAETESSLISTTQIPLPDGGTRLSAGMCQNDGFVIDDGKIYRLGAYVGPDITGISSRSRVSNGQAICHNLSTWSALVQYVCNVNTAAGSAVDDLTGTYSGWVNGPTEWLNFVPTQYPSQNSTESFHFGHSDHPSRANAILYPAGDPCPKSSKDDVPLFRIECCATPAAP